VTGDNQEVCQFVLVKLHYGTIDQAIVAASVLLRFEKHFTRGPESQIDVDVTA